MSNTTIGFGTTYGPLPLEGRQQSYYMDRAVAATYMPMAAAASERLARFEIEAARHLSENADQLDRISAGMAHDSTGVNERMANLNDYVERTANMSSSRDIESLAVNYRAGGNGSTGLGVGGEWVTPSYLVNEYIPYLSKGRSFADGVASEPLPEYGMLVQLPFLASAASASTANSTQTTTQDGGTEGTTVATATFGTGFRTAPVNTLSGQLIISNQLLERAGGPGSPGFQFDVVCFKMLQRASDEQVNDFTLNAALASANLVNASSATGMASGNFTLTSPSGAVSSASAQVSFYAAVEEAKRQIRTAPGTFLDPDKLYVSPTTFAKMCAAVDADNRPVLVPRDGGPYNAVGGSLGAQGSEGDTGFRFGSLDLYQTASLEGASAAVVLDSTQHLLFEGVPFERIVPQTLASNLQVLIQRWTYLASVPRYPEAISKIALSF